MSLFRRVGYIFQHKYESVKSLDVHDSWCWVLTSSLIVNKRPDEQKERFYAYHIITSILFLLSSARYALALAFSDGHNGHLYGHTMEVVGTNLSYAIGVSIFAQCCLYRLILIRLNLTDGMIVPQTLRNIVDEADSRLHDSKTKMARNVLFCAVTGYVVIMIGAGFTFLGMHVLNIMSSNSAFEIFCWMLWWANDLFYLTLAGPDLALYPAMWLLIILNYRIDVVTLTQAVDQALTSGGLLTGRAYDNIRFSYMRLVKQAVAVNRMSSLILFSIILCTTPTFCIALFIFEHGDNLFVSVTIVITVTPMILFPWSLLAIAAELTSLTERLHGRLCSLSAEQNGNAHLSLGHRIRLLQMLEQMGSEEQLLAMRTVDGPKYTSESLTYYPIDTVLHYTLLLTFDRSMKLP